MTDCTVSTVRFLDKLKDFPILLFRIMLAWGFWPAAYNKFQDPSGCADYFAALGIPFPLLMSYVVMLLEGLGCVMLALGLGTRLIAIPLLFIMLVALFVAHIPHGIDYRTPLVFSLTLFSLMTTGGGRFSVDYYRCKGERSLRK